MTPILHRLGGLAAAITLAVSPVRAAWTSLSLPDLAVDFGSYQGAHLSDGRLIFGSKNDLDRQSLFQTSGSVQLDDYANALTWDPSSVRLFGDTLGVIGAGGFLGPSQLFTFDPSNLSTPFAPIPGVTLQNYSVHFRDAASLYVGGQNGTGGRHSVSYVTLAGTQRVLIDDISTFSGDMALDAAGNLYVSDNDDLALYKFSAAQLSTAIAFQTTLTLAEGLYLTTLSRNSSLAIDSLGRVWSAGFQGSGIEMFDPGNGIVTAFTPALPNTNYVVSAFSVAGAGYVGFINAGGFAQGSSLTYGFDLVENLVPEPGSAASLLLGMLVFARRRRGLRPRLAMAGRQPSENIVLRLPIPRLRIHPACPRGSPPAARAIAVAQHHRTGLHGHAPLQLDGRLQHHRHGFRQPRQRLLHRVGPGLLRRHQALQALPARQLRHGHAPL
ncbi:MAG: PEP-CTERM sorting domain-containing protein [Chthoniobacteraceae bacterium]